MRSCVPLHTTQGVRYLQLQLLLWQHTSCGHVLLIRLAETGMFLLQVSIQRVWERESRTVVVRWNLRAFPRILDNVMGTMVNLDGLSEYHFNDEGHVHMHKVCALTEPGFTVHLCCCVCVSVCSTGPAPRKGHTGGLAADFNRECSS